MFQLKGLDGGNNGILILAKDDLMKAMERVMVSNHEYYL